MKSKIIEQLKTRGFTQQEAEKSLTAVAAAVLAVAKADPRGARIPDFGTFKVKLQPARSVRNPRTGESSMSLEKRVLKFKQSELVL